MNQPEKLLNQPNIIMTIAGSDSGCGAGIQADMKTIAALQGYGVTVITAITAQNTCGVTAIHSVPVEIIEKQFFALYNDFEVKSVKTGMLQNVEVIDTVARCIAKSNIKNFVLDPVMVATSGDKLILDDTAQALAEKLFPLSTIITPNLDEAEILLDCKITSFEDMNNCAIELLKFGSKAVLLKGGHLLVDKNGENKIIYDILVSQDNPTPIVFENTRIFTDNVHGTGCTLSAAIATLLTKEKTLETAVAKAEEYIHKAIIAGSNMKLGKGSGPLWHFV